MKCKITGFHKDEEDDWVAELECHHGQHVRHEPPFVNRPWTITPQGRAEKIGHFLECVKCDQNEPIDIWRDLCTKDLLVNYKNDANH